MRVVGLGAQFTRFTLYKNNPNPTAGRRGCFYCALSRPAKGRVKIELNICALTRNRTSISGSGNLRPIR